MLNMGVFHQSGGFRNLLTISILIVIVLQFDLVMFSQVNAVGTWQGKNTLHVPISWCALKDSPAVASPNVPSEAGGVDKDTNSILWRRHERPTDNIWINQAGISLRSAINNVWGTVNFPNNIADPDTNHGSPGDITHPKFDNLQSKVEVNQIINSCRKAWDNLGRSGIGVTAVNVNLMHDDNGKYDFAGGYGEFAINNGKYSGFIAVVDNHYLYPLVPNRNFPVNPDNPTAGNEFGRTDPFDQLVGHELGHILGLGGTFDAYVNGHNPSQSALMYFQNQDLNGDGRVDNIALNTDEAKQARSTAASVPGLEQDPLGEILKGEIVETIKPDDLGENNDTLDYVDLSATRVVFDTNDKKVYFGQELSGLVPNQTESFSQYWTLVDADNNKETGANNNLLQNIHIPSSSNFTGAELVIRTDVKGGIEKQISSSVWSYQDGTLAQIPSHHYYTDLVPLMGIVDYLEGDFPIFDIFPVKDIVSISISNNYPQISFGKPFNIETMIVNPPVTKDVVVDKLNEQVVLDYPSFPQCYVLDDAFPGQNSTVYVEGLRPNSGIHGLLGPLHVFNATTDSNGNAVADYPIPPDTATGLHLVTIGIDGTALTADCEVDVKVNEGNQTTLNNVTLSP